MKKYTQYRAALFIALLGFNTLSACVNTRKELGWSPFSRLCDSLCPARREGNATIAYNNLQNYSKFCFWAMIITASGKVVWPGILQPGTSVVNGNNNGTNVFNNTTPMPSDGSRTPVLPSPLPSNSTMNEEETESITKGMEDFGKQWSNGSSTTEGPTSTTAVKPDDGVPLISDSKFLERRVIRDIIEHGWSPARIGYWLDEKGLNINARGERGDTLLLIVSFLKGSAVDKEKSIKFLIDNGADVNAQNNGGWTALMFVVEERHLDEDIVNLLDIVKLLVENGANPCIKNKNGCTVRSSLEEMGTKWLKQATPIIEYLDTLPKKCETVVRKECGVFYAKSV